MGKIISVCHLKGGVGKTTTCVNLSAALGVLEKKVLVIDTDSLANATISFGFDAVKLNNPALQFMDFSSVLKNNIIKTNNPNVDLLPYFEDVDFFKDYSKSSRFKKALHSIVNSYDFIIIDCAAFFKTKNLDIISSSDSVIIPVQCGYYALEGLHQFLKTLHYIQKNINSSIKIEGLLLTMFDARNKFSKQVKNYMQRNFKEIFFNSVIHRSSKITQAPGYGESIIEYDVDSIGSKNYIELANEIILKNDDLTFRNVDVEIPLKEIFFNKTIITSTVVDNDSSVAQKLFQSNTNKFIKKTVTPNDLKNLIGLTKNDVKNTFGLYKNKVENDIWIFKLNSSSKNFFKKRYLYIYFEKNIIKHFKTTRFKF